MHAFQVEPAKVASAQPMFSGDASTTFAITAANDEAFAEIREQRCGAGADCEVVDYGAIVAFNIEDPDGSEIEICCFKPGVDLTTPRARPDCCSLEDPLVISRNRMSEGGRR